MHHIKPKIIKTNGKQRNGKGFSLHEIEKAGLKTAQARRIGLPVDLRRKTAHEENVATVKAYAEKAKVKTKPKLKSRPKAKPKRKPKSQKTP